MHRILFALVAACALPCASAQVRPSDTASASETATGTAAEASTSRHCCTLAAGTTIRVELLEALTSSERKPGDRFGLRVVKDIAVEGKVVIPAGTLGAGEVVSVVPAQQWAQPGHMTLSADYLELKGRRILLRDFTLGGTAVERQLPGAVKALLPSLAASDVDLAIGSQGDVKLAQALADFSSLTAPAASDTNTTAVCCVLPSGTPVQLEILDLLNSAARKRGDTFGLRVIDDVRIDGTVVIPAGTLGRGEIVHAAAARGGGAPGELLVAARTLDLNGQTVRLRGLRLGATGIDNSGKALGLSLAVGAFAMFVRGHEIEIPASTRVEAKIADALTLAPMPPSSLSSNTQQE